MLLVLTEVRVLHGLGCRQPLLVVVAQQLVQQVQSLRTHQVLVLRLDELLPALPCLPGHKPATCHYTGLHLPPVRNGGAGSASRRDEPDGPHQTQQRRADIIKAELNVIFTQTVEQQLAVSLPWWSPNII